MSSELSLKSLTCPGSNDILQAHSNLTFKLLKTVADFSQALASLHDKFGHELQVLVETFRKRNGELRKERLNCPNSLFQIWELFLQQVEVNSQQHGDISRSLAQTTGSGLIERVFHRKIQSKKTFAYRERIETILLKSNELLHKCYNDYCQAYALALTNPAQYMSEYIASHNVYVHQLQATNGMIHAYQTKTLPKLLEELEECHLETSSSISGSLLSSSEVIAEKSTEQASGYSMIASACRQANHRQDLGQFIKVASANPLPSIPGGGGDSLGNSESSTGADESGAGRPDKLASLIRYHQFQAPSSKGQTVGEQFNSKNLQLVPKFKNEIAPDLGQPPSQQQPQLEKDRESLEEKIERLEERLESLAKLLFRSSESRLNNKVNEIQEEICQKRFDLLVAQIHLSAVRSQLQLFEYNYRPSNLSQSTLSLLGAVPAGGDLAEGGGPQAGALAGSGVLADSAELSRKPGANHHHHHGYRSKWIKALKSLKETPDQPHPSPEQVKFANDSDQLKNQQDLLAFVGSDGAAGVGQQFASSANLVSQQASSGSSSQQQPENQHFFQEYTFKKIASCDVCKDFLRGHMRQGVKCKLCKISCHNDCQSKAHVILKCQQPKIKLLRRQKSAGELEVNNTEAESSVETERSSSKPDGIYQLIRQVLDAKKRGQQQGHPTNVQAADEHHLRVSNAPIALAGSAMMNLSTGNLALANKNGGRQEAGDQGLSSLEPAGLSAKRHSKQLDKFKLAARSAAAASKSQRVAHGNLQSGPTNQQATHSSSNQMRSNSPAAGSVPLQMSNSIPIGPPTSGPAGGQQPYHQLDTSFLGHTQLMAGEQSSPTATHLHHTKSLPVGGKQSLPVSQEQLMMMSGAHQQTYAHHMQQTQPAQAQQPQQVPLHHQQPSSSLANAHGSRQGAHPVQHQHHQLLNIGAQQIHSTSAPHSPQRKRFNLRMKSFSLDSPESPSMVGAVGHGLASEHNSGASLAESQPLYQQQHPPAYQSGSVYLPSVAYQQPGATQYVQQQRHPQSDLYQQTEPQQQSQQQLDQQRDQQQQQQLTDNQSYMANNGMRLSRHQFQPGGYDHRHSYHNPSLHYQHQHEHQSQQQQQQQHQQSSSQNTQSSGSQMIKAPSVHLGTAGQAKRGSKDNATACILNDYYDLGQETSASREQAGQQQSSSGVPTPSGTFVVLYDYLAQRVDEIQLTAGQLVTPLDTSEGDWWKVRVLDGSQRLGFFPSTYLAKLYQNERPLQVAQTIQVSDGESCVKLLRGQIVVHTGKQIDNFVTIRKVSGGFEQAKRMQYIQCPEKYLMETGV